MTKRLPSSRSTSMRTLLNRRKLFISASAGAVTIAIGRSVASNDELSDYHVDDSDHKDDHGDDRDKDDIQPVGTVPPGSAEVVIDDDDADGFEPDKITIDLGGSVTWVNLDDDPHTATGSNFDTGRIDSGAQATVTFDEPGSFPYSCSFHPIMTGTVEVRDETGEVPARSVASPQASPGASPQASPASSQGAEVSILTLEFDPVELQVSVGTTVVWTNTKAVPHTVTSVDDAFGSERLELDDTFSHQFTSAGTFNYFCAIHPSMKATVTVTD